MLLMGCKWKASLPYGYGNRVPAYLWKCINELYHELPFTPILIFSFLALHKTCKVMRKEFARRKTPRTWLRILLRCQISKTPTIIIPVAHKF